MIGVDDPHKIVFALFDDPSVQVAGAQQDKGPVPPGSQMQAVAEMEGPGNTKQSGAGLSMYKVNGNVYTIPGMVDTMPPERKIAYTLYF
jgi:hypothetical protein